MIKNLPAKLQASGRAAGVGDSNPLQYSGLEDPMDRGAWRTTVHGVAKESNTTEVTEHTIYPFPLEAPHSSTSHSFKSSQEH